MRVLTQRKKKMDVLIKNMELPKDDKIIILAIDSEGNIDQQADYLNCFYHLDNKAIALPPHGRLIDADELEKAVEKMVVCDSYEYTIAHEIVKKLLKMAPTVLEASE